MKRLYGLVLSLILISSSAWAAAADRSPAMAVVFPGVVQDRDFNSLAFDAMNRIAETFSLKTDYAQLVSVESAEAVISHFVENGYNIIWMHGGQFTRMIFRIRARYPRTVFIVEGGERPAGIPENVVVIGGWTYHKSFYVLGALGARWTKTGHVGYVGGMRLSFTFGEINAARQALIDYDPSIRLHYYHVGDFNDPIGTRYTAEGLIHEGCDVLLSSVNLGNFGLFEAVKNAERPVWFTTTYVRKEGYLPHRYLTSDRVDYYPLLHKIVQDILNRGVRSGYYEVEWGEGKSRYIEFPIHNVPPALNREMEEIAQAVADGRQPVEKITDRILPDPAESTHDK